MKRNLLGIVAGAMLTATAAFADTYDDLPSVLTAPQPTGASCVSLQRQFDTEIVRRASAPKAASARQKRKTGEQKCNSGRYEAGVKDLTRALQFIDVRPAMQ